MWHISDEGYMSKDFTWRFGHQLFLANIRSASRRWGNRWHGRDTPSMKRITMESLQVIFAGRDPPRLGSISRSGIVSGYWVIWSISKWVEAQPQLSKISYPRFSFYITLRRATCVNDTWQVEFISRTSLRRPWTRLAHSPAALWRLHWWAEKAKEMTETIKDVMASCFLSEPFWWATWLHCFPLKDERIR